MALAKTIQLDSGAVAGYFNIADLSFQKGSGCRATFNMYHSKAVRDANPAAILSSCELDFPSMNDPSLANAYEAAKAHPSGMFLDAADA